MPPKYSPVLITQENQTSYYEICSHEHQEECHDFDIKLQYTNFNTLGLQELIRYYKEEKNYNLPIILENYLFKTLIQKDLHKSEYKKNKIIELYKSLGNNQLTSFILLSKLSENNLLHATPYIIAKKDDELILVIFEDKDQNLKKYFEKIKIVPNYSHQKNRLQLQHDDFSCSTFSLDILKNCLLDEEFIESCFSDSPQTKPVKERMGQSSQYEVSFKLPYRAVFDQESGIFKFDDNGNINLKAWYKGHDYARKINPNHLELLDGYNRDLFLAIDKKRHHLRFGDVDEKELSPDVSTGGASSQALAGKGKNLVK